MQRRTLGRTGIEVSSIGFGAAPLGQEYGELDEAGGARLVARALELGVTLFDVAPYYGRTLSEERLGRAEVPAAEQLKTAPQLLASLRVAARDVARRWGLRSLSERRILNGKLG